MATDDVARALAIKAIQGGGGTTVVANPTLAGTEAALEGLQVGETKYKVDGGGSALVATVTYDEIEERLTVDKTFNELSAAFAAKTPLYLILPDGPVFILPVRYTADAEHILISWDFFMITDLQGTPTVQITINNLTIATNNIVTFEENTIMCSGTTP